MNEKTEVALREIIYDNIDEFEPEIDLNSKTLEDAIAMHEDIFRTHYRFTDKDFDNMVLQIMHYYHKPNIPDNDMAV